MVTSVRIVENIPDGFIKLDEAMKKQKNGLTYSSFEKEFYFMDINDNLYSVHLLTIKISSLCMRTNTMSMKKSF